MKQKIFKKFNSLKQFGRPTNEGFTLVELLLSIGIASTVLSLTSVFLFNLLEAQTKNQSISEVEEQGRIVMQKITRAIGNAEAVTAPTPGASAPSLTLNVVDISDDPTIFDLLAGTLRITEGLGGASPLTNSRVTVSGLTFSNLSRPQTPGVVRFSFTLTTVNDSGRSAYNFSKTFYSSVNIRE